jgi:hypothetical protein
MGQNRNLLLRLHSGETSTEGFPQVVVQNMYTGFQQQMGIALGPAHLLFLHKTLANHVVHG